MDTIQVVKELRQLAWTMGPGDERIIHVAEPAEWLVDRRHQSRFLKMLHEEVGDDGGYWRTHGHTVGLLVELSV
jgi:hypothetical protein